MSSVESTHYCEMCLWSPKHQSGKETTKTIFRHHLLQHVNKTDKFRLAYLQRRSKYHKTVKVQCDYCSQVYSREYAFHHFTASHSNLLKSDKRIYRLAKAKKQCDVCLQQVCVVNLYNHFLAMHTKLSDIVKHVCDHCECAFLKSSSVARHWFRMHTAPLSEEHRKTVECDVCLKEFHFQKDGKAPIKNLYQHFLVRHSNAAEKFFCDVCTYSSTSLNNLWRHTTFAGHLAQMESNKPACDICGIEFFHKKSVLNHHRFKHGRKEEVETFHCEKCDFWTNFKFDLSAHAMQRCMLKGVRYQCEDCKGLFKTRPALYHHKAHDHNNQKKTLYVCDGCDKSYTSKWALLQIAHCKKVVGYR